jgi:hypothetical protein
MSLELNPMLSYTVFLLPFAYDPVKSAPEKANSQVRNVDGTGYSWRPLDWDTLGVPSSLEIQEFEKAEQMKFVERFHQDRSETRGPSSAETEEHLLRERLTFITNKRNERSPSWRLQYFMPETNAILYNRAKWFELQDASGSSADKLPGSDGLRCCMDYCIEDPEKRKDFIPLQLFWGRLILFEYPDTIPNKYIPSDDRKFARNGILALKIGFKVGTQPTLNHLLLLNEAFRYYKIPFYKQPESFKRHDILPGLPGPHENEAKAESYSAMWDSLLSLPLIIDENICDLMPESWHDNAKKQAFSASGDDYFSRFKEHLKSSLSGLLLTGNADASWDVYPDNRAFVWTCAYLANSLAPNLLPDFCASEFDTSLPAPFPLNLWHALLDVDTFPDEIDTFRYKWLRERTYTRWARKGTLYGFNNYSVAMLGHPKDFIPFHYESMYLDMGLILLQARTSLFRISKIISQDTQVRLRESKKRIHSKWVKQFRRFRGEFAAFVNIYHFPLLSTQQQAIEMYEKMRSFFDIDAIFSEVKSEIESTHEHAELEADKATENGINTLTTYGLGIALGALIGQIFGMSDILGDLSLAGHLGYFYSQTKLVIAFAFLGGLFASWRLKRSKHK